MHHLYAQAAILYDALRQPTHHTRTTVFLSLATFLCIIAGIVVNPILGVAPALVVFVVVLILFFIRYPHLWLYTAALLNYFWVSQGTGEAEITPKEYALVGFYFGGLTLWFFGMVIVQRRRIIRHFGDKLILTTMALSVLNLPVALMHGTPPFIWLREWLLFWMMLYYFPMREHLITRKQMQIFFVCHAAVFIVIGGMNLYNYTKAASNVLYAYQIWASRKTLNTNIFLSATLFTALGGLYAARRNTQILLLFLSGFYAVVVVASFSRGFWIAGMVGISVVLWLLDRRKLALFALYAVLAGMGFVVLVQVVFPDKAEFVLKVLQARFTSSARGTHDLSLLARFYETKSLLSELSKYPVSGFGFGSSYRLYDPIGKEYNTVSFIHNGYLFVWLKAGLAFFIAYYGFWLYMLRRAYTLASTTTVGMAKILAASCFACLIAFLLLNITSSITEGRDGFFSLSICFASLGFAEYLHAQGTGHADM